ncbi:MAG: hypothetical protein Fur0022_37700 [Anaerolineales bacterium]
MKNNLYLSKNFSPKNFSPFLLVSTVLFGLGIFLTTALANPLPQPFGLPPCENITAGPFAIAGEDALLVTITNLSTQAVSLTETTLIWTDYYDPDMFVDYFRFGGTTYWNGNDFDSPTTQASNVPLPGLTSADWDMDFDGYGNIFGQIHTIGPFSLQLVFDNTCEVTVDITLVETQIVEPANGEVITSIEDTRFEAIAWDTGVGTNNGDGIELVHLVLLDPSANVIVNTVDSTSPYCVWGSGNPCPMMSSTLWDSLPDGTYTFIAWAKSSVTGSWSAPAQVDFVIDHNPITPTATLTSTPTNTPTPTLTPTATPTNTPTPSQTPAPTETQLPTSTPTPTEPAPVEYWLFLPVLLGAQG